MGLMTRIGQWLSAWSGRTELRKLGLTIDPKADTVTRRRLGTMRRADITACETGSVPQGRNGMAVTFTLRGTTTDGIPATWYLAINSRNALADLIAAKVQAWVNDGGPLYLSRYL